MKLAINNLHCGDSIEHTAGWTVRTLLKYSRKTVTEVNCHGDYRCGRKRVGNYFRHGAHRTGFRDGFRIEVFTNLGRLPPFAGEKWTMIQTC